MKINSSGTKQRAQDYLERRRVVGVPGLPHPLRNLHSRDYSPDIIMPEWSRSIALGGCNKVLYYNPDYPVFTISKIQRAFLMDILFDWGVRWMFSHWCKSLFRTNVCPRIPVSLSDVLHPWFFAAAVFEGFSSLFNPWSGLKMMRIAGRLGTF